MWIPDKWQEDLLWHFLRTGDYFAGLSKRPDYNGGVALLIVGGNEGDLKKLYAIKTILGGEVRRTNDYYRGPSPNEWEYLWIANEHTERYLRWFEDKWENSNIIDSPPRRGRVRKALEAIDEDNTNRQDQSKSA